MEKLIPIIILTLVSCFIVWLIGTFITLNTMWFETSWFSRVVGVIFVLILWNKFYKHIDYFK
jgi:hypothetical protein